MFSTRLHGESFTRMVAGLCKRGPTLLLIKDTRGHVFGGFASHAWEVKPQFQGEALALFGSYLFNGIYCFLFSYIHHHPHTHTHRQAVTSAFLLLHTLLDSSEVEILSFS